MIKKYFAMTIIAASVSLAACSDDDDDVVAGGVNPTQAECVADPTITLCATLFPDTQPSALTATVDDPAVSAYDVIGGSDVHSDLLAALKAVPALANAADSSDSPVTVLAPDNTAFATVVAANGAVDVDALIVALTTDDTSTADIDESAALARILSYHVIPGVATLAIDTSVDTALVDDNVAVQLAVAAGAGGSGLSVTDSAGAAVDLAEVALAPTGNVYTLNAVLTPPAAPVVDNSGPGTGTGTGTGAAALIGDGTAYSEAGAAFLSTAGDGFPESLDNTNGNTDVFMFFVPSNAAMTAATLTGAELTAADVKRHIQTTVTVLAAGETVTTVGAAGPYAVAADADLEGGFTVGGFPVTLLGETPAGGEIYGIEGVLP